MGFKGHNTPRDRTVAGEVVTMERQALAQLTPAVQASPVNVWI